MTKLNIEIGGESDYQGSKMFTSLAEALGLSVDLVINYALKKVAGKSLRKIFFFYFCCFTSHPLDTRSIAVDPFLNEKRVN
jgi:hypothetical protein